jgi:hypothetical protein
MEVFFIVTFLGLCEGLAAFFDSPDVLASLLLKKLKNVFDYTCQAMRNVKRSIQFRVN